jgi:hypothetical protein
MKPKSNLTRDCGAFLLMENIVSIALFAMVGTAMVAALHSLGNASNGARTEIAMNRRFESIMAEISHGSGSHMKVGIIPYQADGSGISVVAEIIPATLFNSKGSNLDSIYSIKLTGVHSGDPTSERVSERLIYHKQHGRP